MSKVMAVNAGSSSLKFQLLEMPSEQVVAQGIVERIGQDEGVLTIKYGDTVPTRIVGHSENSEIKINKVPGKKKKIEMEFANHEDSIKQVLKQLKQLNIITDFSEISGVGHRVVAGGELFNKPTLVDEEVLTKIKKLSEFAPLHNTANAIGIEAFTKLIPSAIEVAVFDTSFHQTIPQKNYLYSIPYEYYTKYGVRKYGAHGISYSYITQRAAELLDKPKDKVNLIIMHLGAGASVAAVKNGKSMDTSMGFTPLTGLTMATRSGDIDPSLLYYLQEKEGLSDAEMLNILNTKSGMLGISSLSSDMRDLEEVQETNTHAKLALDIFKDRAIKYAAQYMTTLGGVDAIVFTAGIGENSPETRQAVIDSFSYMGAKIDEEANNVRGKETVITTSDSTVKGMLIPTNEELEIARDVAKFLK